MGSSHDKPKCGRCASPRRPRARICLRKGCGRKYQPRCSHQRFCQDPECKQELRRWQAARRQARRRQDVAVKARHAEAERVRRQRAASSPETLKNPAVAAARGHAVEDFFRHPCATGRGAMNRPRARSATQPATAAPPAARPFAMSSIANASGDLAARWMAAGSAPTSTPGAPGPASSGLDSNTSHPARHPHGHLPSDDARRPRRSSLIALLHKLD